MHALIYSPEVSVNDTGVADVGRHLFGAIGLVALTAGASWPAALESSRNTSSAEGHVRGVPVHPRSVSPYWYSLNRTRTSTSRSVASAIRRSNAPATAGGSPPVAGRLR